MEGGGKRLGAGHGGYLGVGSLESPAGSLRCSTSELRGRKVSR